MTATTTEDRAYVSVAPKLGFVGAFDGMRGIGMMWVLIGHIFPEDTDSLNPLVDFFFIISAFLIVSLLMQERRDRGTIDLRRFYTRRALRLLPNAYACMLAWLLIWGLIKAAGITGPADGMKQVNAIPGNVLAAATYVYHLVYPIGGETGPLVQFWTLSQEEQFYIVVGFGLVAVLAIRRRVWILSAVLGALVVWIGWSRWNVDLGPWPGKEYSLDIKTRGLRLLWMARPDALMYGVLLAILNSRIPDPISPRLRRVIVWSGTLGAVAWVLVLSSSLAWLHQRNLWFWVPGIPRDPSQMANRGGELWCALEPKGKLQPCTDHLWFYRWGFTAAALAVLPLTLMMVRAKDAPLCRLIALKPFRWVGERSYSLYVWHLLAFVLATFVTEGMGTLPRALVKIAAAFALAGLAHKYIDRAVDRLKDRWTGEKPPPSETPPAAEASAAT